MQDRTPYQRLVEGRARLGAHLDAVAGAPTSGPAAPLHSDIAAVSETSASRRGLPLAMVSRCAPRSAAFTLIELLVVMAIIGLLAAISLPALKGFGKGTGMAGAQRQLLQDLGLARLSAINGRTTVYMVFVPTNLVDVFESGLPEKTLMQLTNLISGQYTAYALLTKRTVGDQPGRETPRYITDWRSLPQGVLIATNKFDQNALTLDFALGGYPPDYKHAFPLSLFPFPTSKSPVLWPLPYIAFNSQGQLASGRDELIPLAEGSIFYAKNSQGKYVSGRPDLVIKPPNNYTNHFIRINWLTGRPSVDEATRPRFP